MSRNYHDVMSYPPPKEDTGKSINNTLYILWYAKCQAVKNQPLSSSHYRVMLA